MLLGYVIFPHFDKSLDSLWTKSKVLSLIPKGRTAFCISKVEGGINGKDSKACRKPLGTFTQDLGKLETFAYVFLGNDIQNKESKSTDGLAAVLTILSRAAIVNLRLQHNNDDHDRGPGSITIS